MAVVIRPKSVFDRDIERLNDNYITKVNAQESTESYKFNTLCEENESFWQETEVSGSYRYYINEELLKKYYAVEDNGLEGNYDQGNKTVLYKYNTYSFLDGDEYDYETFVDYEEIGGIKYATKEATQQIVYAYGGGTFAKKSSYSTAEPATTQETGINTSTAIMYYEQTTDGDLQEFILNNCSNAFNIIVLLDETNAGLISYIVAFKIFDTIGGTYNYYVNVNGGVELKFVVINAISSSDKDGYNMQSNELSVYNTIYASNEEITNDITIQRVGLNYRIVAKSQSPVASKLKVDFKSPELFGVEQIFGSVYIEQGQTTSNQFDIPSGYVLYIGQFEITNITPPKDGTYVYFDERKPLLEHLKSKIVSNYQNGKVTMNLECSIDDYYDQSAYKYDEINNEYDYDIIVDKSKKIISKRGGDGLPMTFTNNDIVLPKRVVMAKSSQGDVYSHKEVDMVNGKQFRVVGVKVKYDGHITQELTLQEEKT